MFRTPNVTPRVGLQHQWRSQRQKTLVHARLINAGIDVTVDTPVAECWRLLTDLMLSEIRQ